MRWWAARETTSLAPCLDWAETRARSRSSAAHWVLTVSLSCAARTASSPSWCDTQSPTREILTVRTEATPLQTAFFDPDPSITPAEAEALLSAVEVALDSGTVHALTLSGSSPAPATHGLYSDLIALALARRVPVFLDTYGPALDGIWGFWPTAFQLNRREAALRLRKPSVTDDDVAGLLKDWHRRGATCGVITDGPNPVSIAYRGRRYRAIPPSVEVVNPIGSGDSLLGRAG